MTTSSPQSEREKLIDAQLFDLHDLNTGLAVKIKKLEETVLLDTIGSIDGALRKLKHLDESNSDLHELNTCLLLKIQRLEAHTGCDKYVPGLDDPADTKK